MYVSLRSAKPWAGKVAFDYARLNEWPEWFAVDENTLYKVRDAAGETVKLAVSR